MEKEPFEDMGVIAEAAGKDTVTPEQYGHLHDWDLWMEDLFPQLDELHEKVHGLTPWEMKMSESLSVID